MLEPIIVLKSDSHLLFNNRARQRIGIDSPKSQRTCIPKQSFAFLTCQNTDRGDAWARGRYNCFLNTHCSPCSISVSELARFGNGDYHHPTRGCYCGQTWCMSSLARLVRATLAYQARAIVRLSRWCLNRMQPICTQGHHQQSDTGIRSHEVPGVEMWMLCKHNHVNTLSM